jgi:hypothetical protein
MKLSKWYIYFRYNVFNHQYIYGVCILTTPLKKIKNKQNWALGVLALYVYWKNTSKM